jgi:hypothetical protein
LAGRVCLSAKDHWPLTLYRPSPDLRLREQQLGCVENNGQYSAHQPPDCLEHGTPCSNSPNRHNTHFVGCRSVKVPSLNHRPAKRRAVIWLRAIGEKNPPFGWGKLLCKTHKLFVVLFDVRNDARSVRGSESRSDQPGRCLTLFPAWRALALTACPMRLVDHSRKPERKRAGPEYFGRAPWPGMAWWRYLIAKCDRG